MTTYPKPRDPTSAFTRGAGSSEAHTTDHGRVIGIWENVQHYGAHPSASASANSTAFTAAMAALASGGKLYIPGGTYSLSSDLTIPATGTTIQGVGRNETILSFAAGKSVKSAQVASLSYVNLRDLWVAGAGSGVGIDFGGIGRSTIRDCNVSSFTTGIKIHDVGGTIAGTHHNIISGSVIAACTTGLWLTAGAQGANDGEIYGGEFSNNTTGVLIDTTNIDAWQMSGTSLESNTTALNLAGVRCHFFPGRFESNTTDLVYASGAIYNHVQSAFFDPTKTTDNSGNFSNTYDVYGWTNASTEKPVYIQTFDPRVNEGTCANEAQFNVYASRVQPLRTRNVTSLSFVPTNPAGNVQVSIVDIAANSLLSASSTTAMGTTNVLQTVALTSTCTLVAGRTYWLAIKFDDATAQILGLAMGTAAALAAIGQDTITKKKTGSSLATVIGDFSGMSGSPRTPWLAANVS